MSSKKMIKQSQAIRRLLQTNCLSVFDHFQRLALKSLIVKIIIIFTTQTPRA